MTSTLTHNNFYGYKQHKHTTDCVRIYRRLLVAILKYAMINTFNKVRLVKCTYQNSFYILL